MIAPSLDTVIAQRLARNFVHTVKHEAVSQSDKELLEKYAAEVSAVTKKEYKIPDTLPKAQGCQLCNQTGYLGRVVLAEVIRLDNDMEQKILDKESTYHLQDAAFGKGMISMFMDGVVKVIKGVTSLEEILRVCSR